MAKKKPAKKPAVKKPAAKKPAAKKPAAKKPAVKKKAATSAKSAKPKPKPKAKPTTPVKVGKKPTKKPVKAVAKKSAKPTKPVKEKTVPIMSLFSSPPPPPPPLDGPIPGGGGPLGVPATPVITAPGGGPVPPNMPLSVTVSTNRPDLTHLIELRDTTAGLPGVLVLTIPVNPPGNNVMIAIPGAHFPAGRTFTIRVVIDPAVGTTPPHSDHTVSAST